MGTPFTSILLAACAALAGCGNGGGASDDDGPACGTGTEDCGGVCVNLDEDPANCGACGTACAQDVACVDGACEQPDECAPGTFACGEACVNINNDPANCGDCGSACGADEVCLAAQCERNCAVGLTDCDGECRDLLSDPAACGDCANPCADGQVCSEGACASTCEAGLTECGGACVDTFTDNAHCGDCGQICPETESCLAGSCRLIETGCSRAASATEELTDAVVGCAGTVRWEDRASLCGAGWLPCPALEWVGAARGGLVPSYNYWTDDDLRYTGPAASCWVDPEVGGSCTAGAYGYGGCGGPMHVCTESGRDELGNECTWTNCGYGGEPPPSYYFGGCCGNWTAGTLCCRG